MRIVEHFCSFDKVNDLIVQSAEGEAEWLDLLQHCAMNLSVPSTVSLEFLTLNKPILNIAYNSKGEIDSRINQFFEAGFYFPLFETDSVVKINYPNELINYQHKNRTKLPETSRISNVRASTLIIDLMKTI
jgi:hypothetical protein